MNARAPRKFPMADRPRLWAAVVLLLTLPPLSSPAAGGGGAGPKNPGTAELKEKIRATEVRGRLSIDLDIYNQNGDRGALKLHPGCSVRWDWPEADIPGEWRVTVYDDGSSLAKVRENERPVLIAILDSTGRTAAVGPIHRPGPSEEARYGLFLFKKGERNPARNVQTLPAPRAAGWQEWKFVMSRNRELQIFHNGTLQQTLGAESHGLKGIASLLLEVPPGDAQAQSLWFSGFAEAQERTPNPRGKRSPTGIGF